MISRKFVRAVAIILAAVQLSSCAEINRRGGIVDQFEDFVLFAADTKSHRLFRSYLLVGVLLAAARQAGHNDIDRNVIEGNLKASLEVAFEAHMCLFPDRVATAPSGTNPPGPAPAPGPPAAGITSGAADVGKIGTPAATTYVEPVICQFFDEKMARLDYALYRLALATLFNAESRVKLAEIRDKMIGKLPVVSESIKAAYHANKAVNEVTSIVDDILSLSFNSSGPLLILLPLYRDSLELNMWAIIDNLTRYCAVDNIGFKYDPRVEYPASYAIGAGQVCGTLGYALQIMNNGNGNLQEWRAFVRNMNNATLAIQAYKPHFFLVTRLLWQSCKKVMGDETIDTTKNRCSNSLAHAIDQAAFAEWGVRGEGNRYYTALMRTNTRFARERPPVPAVRLSSPPASKSDRDSTGSIPKDNPVVTPVR
jgi:hypothetical protein